MAYPYRLRSEYDPDNANLNAIDSLDDFDASSSIGPFSSPDKPLRMAWDLPDDVPFMQLDDQHLPDEDEGDFPYEPSAPRRAPRLTDEEKALGTLRHMRTQYSRFSLRCFLETIFKSDNPDIKNSVGIFMEDGGAIVLMNLFWELSKHMQLGLYNPEMAKWITDRAAEICAREASFMTDTASRGPWKDDASALRVSAADVTVSFIKSFEMNDLTARYDRTTPHLQHILRAVTSKGSGSPSSRNTDAARTMITSIALNARSRLTNYHAVVNSLVMWDQCVPKRLLQAFNHLGICTSYSFQIRAVLSLSKDAVRVARSVAADPSKLKMLPYDNFNWRSHAWETSAVHGTVQHDQVSAMLVVLNVPPQLATHSVPHLGSVERFAEFAGRRHALPAQKALRDILPSSDDHVAFRNAAVLHIATILSSDTSAFTPFGNNLPSFVDPSAIIPHKTEQYYLPTFDQEQASTRGNMEVLAHYFLEVLALPKTVFERVMYFVLGDRLTTSRDRAAQDQRAVDRSPWRVDHLSSFAMTSGLMHQCLNMIQNIARNAWGGASGDSVSLMTLRDLLPHREEINTRKFDFYAWLRFLDVILRALIVTAALSLLHLNDTAQLAQATAHYTDQDFMMLCHRIADSLVLPALDRLEADGVKVVAGQSVSGHAVLLSHDLMTLREMRHAIKHGHPERIVRMLKYWTPMFYAGGSYNYAHEDMELLHNLLHDWPDDTAVILRAGMLVNTTGRADGFKECDLDVEHLNASIKARAHGSNATPQMLETITPAIGQVQHLTEAMFDALDVEAVYQRHSHVEQQQDVKILVGHMVAAHTFHFDRDKESQHAVIDLYRTGVRRLAGKDGGHARHLARHKLRLQTRHSSDPVLADTAIPNSSTADRGRTEDRELLEAQDGGDMEFTVEDRGNDIVDMLNALQLEDY